MRHTISEGRTFRYFAKRTIIRIVGLWIPRSTALMYVLSIPLAVYKSIWDIPLALRISRKASPNALSGPNRG